ncbi:MAG: hypothetical protein KGD73_09980 [Candidatus Lokiarchaeota archaeon]|nr:hypothetical protein [Candidatus Lokiarchaeota archaeon]
MPENRSEIMILKLPNHINGEKIEKLILPVSWKRSILIYTEFLNNLVELPKVVILLGIHSGKKIHIERYSWNFKFGIDVDNSFNCGFIEFGNNLRIKSAIDLKKIKSRRSHLKDIKISNFPGSYLCNYVYFHALRISMKHYPVIFVHLPHKNGLDNVYYILLDLITEILNI